jgi:hypothetical protein
MKQRALVFLSQLAIASALHAQNVPPPPPVSPTADPAWQPDTLPHSGIIIYTQYSHLFYQPTPGTIAVQFNYRVEDPSGTFVTDTFRGSNSGSSAAMGNFFALPGIELYRGNWSAEAHICPFQSPGLGMRFNIYGGINYRLRYDKWLSQAADLQPVMENFPVSFGLGLQWHNAVWKLGRVDLSYWQTFKALGISLQQTEDEPEEQESAHVDICYQQSMLVVLPSMTVGWRPKNRFFDISLRVSPYFPFYLDNGFTFLMNDSDTDDRHAAPGFFGMMPVNRAGLHATYNGGHIPKAPYKMNGWTFGIRIGFHFPFE